MRTHTCIHVLSLCAQEVYTVAAFGDAILMICKIFVVVVSR